MEILLWPTVEHSAEFGSSFAGRDRCLIEPWGAVTLPDAACQHKQELKARNGEARPSANSNIDLDLRKNFILNLAKCAQHDFHRASQTHLFFGYYATSCAVRSFHPYKDKAFEVYLILANRLAMATEDHLIQEWIKYIESGKDAEQPVAPQTSKELPCSGVVNFKLETSADLLLENLIAELTIPLSRMTSIIFSKTVPTLRTKVRERGAEKIGSDVRRFFDANEGWRQRTVRIPKPTHAQLLAISGALSVSISALTSFAIHAFLYDASLSGRSTE